MPTAPVDNQGSVLYYEDSGVPNASDDYVTLVVIHGTCFHGAGFRPVIPFATKENIRLVLLNLRGYPGSTNYSAEELDRLEGSLEARKAELLARGLEVAAFTRWFIETENIPPVREVSGRKLSGGISLLSWSGGNGQTLAMFAYADKLPAETRRIFDTYLRSLILYDPSSTAVGNPPPQALKSINVDRTLSPDEQTRQFGLTVASYYPPFTLPDDITDPSAFAPRPPLQEDSGTLDAKYAPTTSKMTPATFRSITHPLIMERAQHLIWSPLMRYAFEGNVKQAIYDCRFDDGSGLKKVWPSVRVHVVWCDMTAGEIAWAVSVLNCGYKEASPDARRPMEMHKLEGANHFVHWEEPERFAKLLAGII